MSLEWRGFAQALFTSPYIGQWLRFIAQYIQFIDRIYSHSDCLVGLESTLHNPHLQLMSFPLYRIAGPIVASLQSSGDADFWVRSYSV